jgi:hypothetical protein
MNNSVKRKKKPIDHYIHDILRPSKACTIKAVYYVLAFKSC